AMVRDLPCGDADPASCSDRSGAAVRDYCEDTRLRRWQDRFVLARPASEDAEYGTIAVGSGGHRGIYCNAQIVRPSRVSRRDPRHPTITRASQTDETSHATTQPPRS